MFLRLRLGFTTYCSKSGLSILTERLISVLHPEFEQPDPDRNELCLLEKGFVLLTLYLPMPRVSYEHNEIRSNC